MISEIDDLVTRLTSIQEVECIRPVKSSIALEECISRQFVHVTFKQTGTELTLKLLNECSKIANADFQGGFGSVHLEGVLKLNYTPVKCIADIDLSTCDGFGKLEVLSEKEYNEAINDK